MHPRGQERGAVLPMSVIGISVVLIFASLVIDLGTQLVNRRSMQLVADVVALDMVRLADGRTEAAIFAHPSYADTLQRAASDNDVDVSALEVEYGRFDLATDAFVDTTTVDECTFLPGGALAGVQGPHCYPDAVRVTATRTQDYAFSPGDGTVTRTSVAFERPVATLLLGSRLAKLAQGDEDALNSELCQLIPVPDVDSDGIMDHQPDTPYDTDGDGIPDVPPDTNGDGIPDPLPDNDGDGIPDVPDPPDPSVPDIDSDDDGIPDFVDLTPRKCSFDFNAVSYQGLVNADVSLLDLVSASGTFGSPDELLAAELTVGEFARLTGDALSNKGDADAATVFYAIADQSDTVTADRLPPVPATDVIDAGAPFDDAALGANFNAFDLVTTFAQLSNSVAGVSTCTEVRNPTGADVPDGTVPPDTIEIPGVGTVGFSLCSRVVQAPRFGIGAVGEPQVSKPSVGGRFQTAQISQTLVTRIALDPIDIEIMGTPIGAATGLVDLPIRLDGAGAVGNLFSIQCNELDPDGVRPGDPNDVDGLAPTNVDVEVGARPVTAEIGGLNLFELATTFDTSALPPELAALKVALDAVLQNQVVSVGIDKTVTPATSFDQQLLDILIGEVREGPGSAPSLGLSLTGNEVTTNPSIPTIDIPALPGTDPVIIPAVDPVIDPVTGVVLVPGQPEIVVSEGTDPVPASSLDPDTLVRAAIAGAANAALAEIDNNLGPVIADVGGTLSNSDLGNQSVDCRSPRTVE